MDTLIHILEKNGFDLSSELGLLKFNYLLAQFIITILLIANIIFLDSSIFKLVLLTLVIISLVLSITISTCAISRRSKQR